jgi:hypothetical protein
MIAIATAATKSYLHAWMQCVRSIATAASHHAEAHFIFSTDESKESKEAEALARNELPEGWKITAIRMRGLQDDAKDYKHAAQLRIAALQGAAFAFARSKLRADMLWSVESDNIVPANALRVLEWTLAMPTADGSPYYDVAAGTYPNGLFLGGFGTPQNPIAEDFLPKERKLKPKLKLLLETCEARLKCKFSPHEMVGAACRKKIKWIEEKNNGEQGFALDMEIMEEAREREMKRMGRLQERVKKSPPDGNIWEVTAKHGWRRRGWMDFAYPGIGEGAVVPSDWCGLGCTLMSKRALALADFNGYDGGGTQDLFLCWHRWHPAGLRIACVPHVVCDHVKKEGDRAIHYVAYHEQSPEYRGHLRTRQIPWVAT